MARTDPSFTMGIEEEYLLVDKDTLDLEVAPDALMEACRAKLDKQVSPEFLQCQIEVGTAVCDNIGQARDDLKRLRACVAECAAEHNLAPIAASCHPFADWKDQHHTPKDRYDGLREALGNVARRMLICGMHVHVGIEDDTMRTDLMPQMAYFLPHMLALSASSPFWQGDDTGLASYRLTVFDNLPRTGLPPMFSSWEEYKRTTDVLIDLDLIEDSTKIWWDLRPSHRFPTLETRICDVPSRLEDSLSLAALNQAVLRMLWRLRSKNQRWRQYDRFLIDENRWRAQRYGVSEGLIDFGRSELVPFQKLIEELIELIEEDATALGSLAEINRLRDIAGNGSSATRQRARLAAELETGTSQADAMKIVVQQQIDEFSADL